MEQVQIEALVREFLKNQGLSTETKTELEIPETSIGVADYPLSQNKPELVKTATNKGLEDISLENVLNRSLSPTDVRITAETLKLQAKVAEAAGRPTLARNFYRAAEMTTIPDDRILEIYNALRPYRSSKDELENIADELENQYNAKICADFVREAARLYKVRKKLKGDN